MTSVKAFVTVQEEFVQELIRIFPDNKRVKAYNDKITELKETNPRELLDSFMNDMKTYGSQVTAQDIKLITHSESHTVKRLALKKLWCKMNDETKKNVWQYLNTMYVLGTTINSVPDSLLASIEAMAEQCAGGLSKDSDGMGALQNMDFGSLMAGMQNMLGGMKK